MLLVPPIIDPAYPVDWANPINDDLVLLSLALPGVSGKPVWPNLASRRRQGAGGTVVGSGGGDLAWTWRGNSFQQQARYYPGTAGGVEGYLLYDDVLKSDPGTSPRTVRIRYQPRVDISIDYKLCAIGANLGASQNFEITHGQSADKIIFGYVDSTPAGNTLTSSTAFPFVAKTEYDIVAIWAGPNKTAKLFVNGVLEASGTAPNLNLRAGSANGFKLGNWPLTFGTLRESLFSECAIWMRELSESEVKFLYANRGEAVDPRLNYFPSWTFGVPAAGGSTYTAAGSLAVTAATLSGAATFAPGTKTASGSLSTTPASVAGSATFASPTYTASGSLSATPATLAGTAEFDAPTYTASGALAVSAATLSGAATYASPAYTASGSLGVTPATMAGSATHTTPTYTASGSLGVTPATLAGTATFVGPTYTASGSLSVTPATMAGTSTFAAAGTFTASGSLSVTPATLSGAATHVRPTYTASGVLAVAAATLSGAAIFAVSVFQAAGSLLASAASLAGSATFSAGTKTASGLLSVTPATLAGSSSFSAGSRTASGSLNVTNPILAGVSNFSSGSRTASGNLSSSSATLSGVATGLRPTYTGIGALNVTAATLSGADSAPFVLDTRCPLLVPAVYRGPLEICAVARDHLLVPAIGCRNEV